MRPFSFGVFKGTLTCSRFKRISTTGTLELVRDKPPAYDSNSSGVLGSWGPCKSRAPRVRWLLYQAECGLEFYVYRAIMIIDYDLILASCSIEQARCERAPFALFASLFLDPCWTPQTRNIHSGMIVLSLPLHFLNDGSPV